MKVGDTMGYPNGARRLFEVAESLEITVPELIAALKKIEPEKRFKDISLISKKDVDKISFLIGACFTKVELPLNTMSVNELLTNLAISRQELYKLLVFSGQQLKDDFTSIKIPYSTVKKMMLLHEPYEMKYTFLTEFFKISAKHLQQLLQRIDPQNDYSLGKKFLLTEYLFVQLQYEFAQEIIASDVQLSIVRLSNISGYSIDDIMNGLKVVDPNKQYQSSKNLVHSKTIGSLWKYFTGTYEKEPVQTPKVKPEPVHEKEIKPKDDYIVEKLAKSINVTVEQLLAYMNELEPTKQYDAKAHIQKGLAEQITNGGLPQVSQNLEQARYEILMQKEVWAFGELQLLLGYTNEQLKAIFTRLELNGVNAKDLLVDLGKKSLQYYLLEQQMEQQGTKYEQAAMQALENIVSKIDMIIVDETSLLAEGSTLFLQKLAPSLRKHKKYICVALEVQEKLLSVKKKYPHKAEQINVILKQLVQLQGEGLVQLIEKSKIKYRKISHLIGGQIAFFQGKRNILLFTTNAQLVAKMQRKIELYGEQGKLLAVHSILTNGLTFDVKLPKYDDKPKFKLVEKLVQLSGTPIPYEGDITTNTVVYNSRKQQIRLGAVVGKGGEGIVYATNQNGVVAKIYKPDKITQGQLQKLKLMVSKPIKHLGICYPIDLLYNSAEQFVGFTMPLAKGASLFQEVCIPQRAFQQKKQHWKRSDLVYICESILEKISFLHKHNIILGDLNLYNILLDENKDVYFVDVDSYQIEGMPCPVGTLVFTAPEIQGTPSTQFLRSFHHDNYAIATLLFMILFVGKAPYSQKSSDTGEQAQKEMNFPYLQAIGFYTDNAPIGNWVYMWDNLPLEIRNAFYHIFHKDGIYAKPHKRLSVQKWQELMRAYAQALQGKFVEKDAIVNEIFPHRSQIQGGSGEQLETCKHCQETFHKQALQAGFCRKCLYKGEMYECASCNTPLVFQNYNRYVLKLTKREPYCRFCKLTAKYIDN